MVKKIEDIYNGLDTIPACDGQTDRRLSTAYTRYAYASRSKNVCLLSDVETTIMETSIENWNGVDKSFDVALFFNVIFHVESGLRQQLLQRLRTQHLNPGGIVMLIENGTPFTSSYIRMMHGLGYVQDNWYKDIAEEVVACGFRLDFEHDIVSTRDLSNPTEGVLKFIELLFEYAVSTEQIRAVITETYNDPAPGMKSVVRKLAVFGKAED